MRINQVFNVLGTLLLSTTLSGCITTTTRDGRQVANEPSAIHRQMASFSSSMGEVMAKVTPKDDPEPILWNWAPGIPQSVSKGEDVPIQLTEQAVTAFLPALNRDGIRLVSNTNSPTPWSVTAVNNVRVRTVADLNAAVDAAVEGETKQSIVEIADEISGQSSVPVEVSSTNLISLAHSCVPDDTPLRLVEGGNSWILLKDEGVRCKVMLRRERRSGLIHVVMGLKLCWGAPRKLPAAVTVRSKGTELSCLSVPQVLRVLYGEAKDEKDEQPVTRFQEIATDDEYITPVNYRQLEARLSEDQRLASIRPTPAFAVVGGYAYPGPPVLGDARALSGFLLQPRVYAADEPEHVGWIVFDGRKLSDEEAFELTVDLGNGPRTVQVRVPNEN